MRLLLINPSFPESWWSSKWVLSEILPGKCAINPPHRRIAAGYSTRDGLAILGRLLWQGILPGGPNRVWHFLRSLSRAARSPTVISHWIVGPSMRGRNLMLKPTQQEVVERRVDCVRGAIGGYLASGKVTLSLQQRGATDAALCLKEPLDHRSFGRAAPALERLLKHTAPA